jgi:hypothetical protein
MCVVYIDAHRHHHVACAVCMCVCIFAQIFVLIFTVHPTFLELARRTSKFARVREFRSHVAKSRGGLSIRTRNRHYILRIDFIHTEPEVCVYVDV